MKLIQGNIRLHARAGKASEDVITLLSMVMDDVDPFKNSNTTPWSPFPMPFRSPLRSTQVPSSVSACDDLVTIMTPVGNTLAVVQGHGDKH